ncbi:MAG: SDR family oxidoreductase [Acidimicrobiales bacterium]
MRALVTGGAGFIGSHVADALLAAGHETRVLDDLSAGHVENIPPGAQLFEGDVSDLGTVRAAIEGVDVVFHQAAHRAVLRSVEHPLSTDQANTHGTLTVLEAARHAGVRRVVYASSSSVYGGAQEMPTTEAQPTLPRSPYAVTKLAGEWYCRVFTALYGLETVALRYFNVYGPRQRPNSAYAAVVPLFIDAVLTKEAATVHGDGRQSRDFTFVSDVVAANLAAATAPAPACAGKAYNIAGGGAHSLLDLLGILGRILEREPTWVHTDPRPGDVRHTWADVTAARRDLAHQPCVGFEEGLRQTVAWFDQRSQDSPSRQQI